MLNKNDYTLVTCTKCRTVSMGVTREWAEDEVRRFNEYFNNLDKDGKELYGNEPSTVDSYKCCKKMALRKFKKGDCPDGCTLSSVIMEEPV